MALTPNNEVHALQIQAGILGRKTGHKFEDQITEKINGFDYPITFKGSTNQHLKIGAPAITLLEYIATIQKVDSIQHAAAISTGALATSEHGKKWLELNGVKVKRCKSDLIITLKLPNHAAPITMGISTKQCNNKNPTNAQLFFTTARGFCNLLRQNGFEVSEEAIHALRQFCGDKGFRPLDEPNLYNNRVTDPRRFFWEEINKAGRLELEKLFSVYQDDITRLLLQKAYLEDPYSPDILAHKTKKSPSWEQTELAIYTIEEIVALSREYGGFRLKPYAVRKGRYKDPKGTQHLAPRFGIVQMQRGGQAQHPEQLQFNLEAGYFYKIKQERFDMQANIKS